MSQNPPMDLISIAMMMAVCDMLATEQARFLALVELLVKKGLVSAEEVTASIESISSIPLEKTEENSLRLQGRIRERLMVHFQELTLRFGPVAGGQPQ
jgi:hypothetical protein